MMIVIQLLTKQKQNYYNIDKNKINLKLII